MATHPRRPHADHDRRGVTTFDEPMSLPRDAHCAKGWRFWIVHPYLDREGFQLVDAIVSCFAPELGEGLDRVGDLMLDLVDSGRMAGPVAGTWPIVIWHPNGDVHTADGRPVRFTNCGGGFAPPAVVARGTHLPPTTGPIRVRLPAVPVPGWHDERGWTFGYQQPFVDSDTQFIELRVGTMTPHLQVALPTLSEWLGELVADGLLAEPSACMDEAVEFSVDPRLDHLAADARPRLTPEAGP